MLTVKSGLADKGKIALYEAHPDHPNGEVKVTGEGEFQVAPTRAVLHAIGEGWLVQVGAKSTKEPDSEPTGKSPEPDRFETRRKGRNG